MAAVSRTDLLAWVNELLQLNYTKVEQCGTGAAYCQIMDSIYGAIASQIPILDHTINPITRFLGDLPMTRVKMNAKHEYEFVANFKVLQNVFKAKKIDKVCLAHTHPRCNPCSWSCACVQPIPIEKLVKCKMQCVHPPLRPLSRSPDCDSRICGRDNLEFLQWIKRFWDSNYGGQGYDAVARRRGAPTDTPATIAPLSGPRSASGLGATGRSGGKTPISGHRAGSTQPNEAMQSLQAQLQEMSTHMEGLEKERDFYFAKVYTRF